jgi:hypothetical protein
MNQGRTILTHFYNEEYLLPWWIKHHLQYFTNGILIDKGSTDRSVEICRELAPHWRIVRSQLYEFDAFLTDHEVMTYEQQVTGWKMCLTATEFFVPTYPVEQIEAFLNRHGKRGFQCTGVTVVDENPIVEPTYDQSLIKQKHFGLNGNKASAELRQKFGDPKFGMYVNRFYHNLPAGMYYTGRHSASHPDYHLRIENAAYVFKYQYAPWGPSGRQRKTQFKATIPTDWRLQAQGIHHTRSATEYDAEREMYLPHIYDLSEDSAQLRAYISQI